MYWRRVTPPTGSPGRSAASRSRPNPMASDCIERAAPRRRPSGGPMDEKEEQQSVVGWKGLVGTSDIERIPACLACHSDRALPRLSAETLTPKSAASSLGSTTVSLVVAVGLSVMALAVTLIALNEDDPPRRLFERGPRIHSPAFSRSTVCCGIRSRSGRSEWSDRRHRVCSLAQARWHGHVLFRAPVRPCGRLC